jgi:hypothetical protein
MRHLIRRAGRTALLSTIGIMIAGAVLLIAASAGNMTAERQYRTWIRRPGHRIRRGTLRHVAQ